MSPLVLLAGLLAVAVAVSVTPRGQEWVDDLRAGAAHDWIQGLVT